VHITVFYCPFLFLSPSFFFKKENKGFTYKQYYTIRTLVRGQHIAYE